MGFEAEVSDPRRSSEFGHWFWRYGDGIKAAQLTESDGHVCLENEPKVCIRRRSLRIRAFLMTSLCGVMRHGREHELFSDEDAPVRQETNSANSDIKQAELPSHST